VSAMRMSASPFASPLEDWRVERRDAVARRRKAPLRYEVGTARRLLAVKATRDAAIRVARKAARRSAQSVFVRDRMARGYGEMLWVFQARTGYLQRIVRREGGQQWGGRRKRLRH